MRSKLATEKEMSFLMIMLFHVLQQEFQDFFPDSFLPTMRPTLMQHHEDGAGEIHRPQEDMNSLILDIKTEPDLLDIDAFVYNDEHEDFSTSKDGWDCESEQENEFTLEQCDDECSTLTIIKKELTEEELSFCGELQSNCKSESIELSNSEEEEVVCDTLLEETEVTMTGTSDKFCSQTPVCISIMLTRCGLINPLRGI